MRIRFAEGRASRPSPQKVGTISPAFDRYRQASRRHCTLSARQGFTPRPLGARRTTEQNERMQTETSSQTELDEPLDAMVIDVHPALLAANYPYQPAGVNPFGPPESEKPSPHWFAAFESPGPAQYVVPQRFGMSAIIGIITALALLFGCFHWSGADPRVYLFFGVQSLVICIVQMFYGRTPRAASAIAGAIVAPAFAMITPWLTEVEIDNAEVLCMMIAGVPIGAFLGYLNGTCAAGLFLVMDKLEPYLQGGRHAVQPAESASSAPAA